MMPVGMAKSAPSPTMISVPTMALAMPPPVSPTGFGIWVKKSTLSARTPSLTTKKKMKASGTSATAIDSPQKPTKTADFALRQVADVMRRPRARRGLSAAADAFLTTGSCSRSGRATGC